MQQADVALDILDFQHVFAFFFIAMCCCTLHQLWLRQALDLGIILKLSDSVRRGGARQVA